MTSPNKILLALALGATLGSCSNKEGSAGERDSFGREIQRREAPRVRVSPVERREMVRTLSILEPIESEREIEVFPRIAGVVDEVRVEVGDRVDTGQVLAVLDRREAEAAERDTQIALKEEQEGLPLLALATKEAMERAERAKLTWEQAQRDYERNENAGLISRNELDQMKLAMNTTHRDYQAAELGRERAAEEEKTGNTGIDRAKLALEREQINLSYTEITAPFAGTIAARTVKVGDSVSSGASLFRLTDADNLRVEIHRPQRELPFFGTAARAGREAGGHEIEIRAFPEAMPDEEYRGDILFITPTVDSTSGSFGITIGLEQPAEGLTKPRLMPGMTVRLEVVTERHADALVVPKRALRREGDSYFVFLVREGKAERVAVTEGFTSDEDVEVMPVTAGAIADNELVVVVGNRDLEDGLEVKAEAWDSDETTEEVQGDAETLAGTPSDEGPADDGSDSEEPKGAEDPEGPLSEDDSEARGEGTPPAPTEAGGAETTGSSGGI